ncbi:MAG: hypothetical protein U1F27_09915 [Turneriella sp.]
MKKKDSIFLFLTFGFLLPASAGGNDAPEQVGQYADEQMEAYVSKVGRRASRAERSVVVEADAKKGMTLYKFHYSFSYGTFRCAITVSEKKGNLAVSEKPGCYENEMP